MKQYWSEQKQIDKIIRPRPLRGARRVRPHGSASVLVTQEPANRTHCIEISSKRLPKAEIAVANIKVKVSDCTSITDTQMLVGYF